MNSEVTWVLVSSRTQVQPQITLDPDYPSGYLSVSYHYAVKLSSNVVSDSNDENNFPHKLLLTYTKVSRLRKAFASNSSASIKLSKIQLQKIGQSGEFLDRLLGPLLKPRLPLMKNVLKQLAKRVLIALRLTAAASATDAAIHKKMFGSGHPTDLASRTATLIILNEEMNDIMKIVKHLKNLVY